MGLGQFAADSGPLMESVGNFSEFGLHYLNKIITFIIPEGHPVVRDWFLMKWWQVLAVSAVIPFLVGNIRVYRFETHPKPVRFFIYAGYVFIAMSVLVYVLILCEIFSYYHNTNTTASAGPSGAAEDRGELGDGGVLSCRSTDNMSQPEDLEMAAVLWRFHVAHLCFDLLSNLHNALTKSVADLRTEQSINEIRFTLVHFVTWWLTLLYYPGGEVIYPVVVVCLFHLGGIACSFSQGKLLKVKMLLWIVLVSSNSFRLLYNLWRGCPFPTTLLALSPPYDINNNIHMMLFYFFSIIPLGGLLHYMLFGRGATCTWWNLLVFLVCAHWPLSSRREDKHERRGHSTVVFSSSAKREQLKRIREQQQLLLQQQQLQMQLQQQQQQQQLQQQNHTKKTPHGQGQKGLGPGGNLSTAVTSNGKGSPPSVLARNMHTTSTATTITATNSSCSSSSSSMSSMSSNSTPTTTHVQQQQQQQQHFPVPFVLYRKCSFFLCNHYERSPKEFKVCLRCCSPYCSPECQYRDWHHGNHKSYCKKFIQIKPHN